MTDKKEVVVTMVKLPVRTKVYKQRQRLWVVKKTGSGKWLLTGKLRGNGDYVRFWVDVKEAKVFNPVVTGYFAEKLGLQVD